MQANTHTHTHTHRQTHADHITSPAMKVIHQLHSSGFSPQCQLITNNFLVF